MLKEEKDVSKIKTAMEELGKASHKLAEEVYKDAQAKQAQQQAKKDDKKEEKSSDKKEENVVDADYKVEDEDKK